MAKLEQVTTQVEVLDDDQRACLRELQKWAESYRQTTREMLNLGDQDIQDLQNMLEQPDLPEEHKQEIQQLLQLLRARFTNGPASRHDALKQAAPSQPHTSIPKV